MGALHQLSLDVLFCMGQVSSAGEYITPTMKETLEGILGETWQLVDLFIEWDWETYFTEHGQENAKYELVNPGIALKGTEHELFYHRTRSKLRKPLVTGFFWRESFRGTIFVHELTQNCA